MTSAAIHHNETAVQATAIRAAVATAVRQAMWPEATDWTSHNTGAGMIIARAVALTDPTVKTTSARSAACFQRLTVAARIVRPTIHPSPAHGNNMTEVRET